MFLKQLNVPERIRRKYFGNMNLVWLSRCIYLKEKALILGNWWKFLNKSWDSFKFLQEVRENWKICSNNFLWREVRQNNKWNKNTKNQISFLWMPSHKLSKGLSLYRNIEEILDRIYLIQQCTKKNWLLGTVLKDNLHDSLFLWYDFSFLRLTQVISNLKNI